MGQEIYNKNLEKIVGLKTLIEENMTKTDYIIEKAVNGEDTLKIKDESGEYIHIHSRYEPSVIAQKQSDVRKLANENIIFIFGVGLGYELSSLMKLSDGFHKIVIYEPNVDILVECLSRVNLKKYNNENMTVCLNSDAIKYVVELECGKTTKDPIIYSNFGYDVLYKEELDEIKEHFSSTLLGKTINDNMTTKISDDWTKNMVRNQKYYYDSYPIKSLFGGIYKDKPAIIVGGGPSLSKNIHLLKELQGSYLILATHTSYKRLIKENIVPDFVVAIDRIQPLLEEYLDTGFDVPLITVGICNPEILEYARSEMFFLKSTVDGFANVVNDEFDKELPDVFHAGTVTGCMMSLALNIGCDPVVMIGQDLAFTDNLTHAKGVAQHGLSVEEEQKIQGSILIDGQNGEKVSTSFVLKSYRDWFEKTLRNAYKDYNVINATEGGANIKGMTNMKLADVIKENPAEKNNAEIYKEIISKGKLFTDEERAEIPVFLADSKRNLEDINVILDETIEVCNKLEKIYFVNNTPSPKKVNKLLKRYDELQVEINERMIYLGFLGIYLDKSMLLAEREYDKYKNENERNIVKMRAYFENLLDCSKKTVVALDQIIDSVKED